MADVRGVSVLEEELARAKEILKDVDENIKKLTGRDPGESRPGQRRLTAPGGGGGNFGGRERIFATARRSLGDATGPLAKRRNIGGAFSRLGPRLGARPGQGRDSGGEEDDPGNKPAVQSSVVATPKDTRTRQDMIKAQNKDPEGKARNRRMFGVLLGTLQSFQKDARTKDDKVQQRKAIEEKLEQKAVEEKERIRKERQTLFSQRKKEQAKLRRLEHKMELVQIHKEWETQTKTLMNFARTKAKPHLFYAPRTHNSATEKKVKETAKILEGIIEERRKQLEEEIEELTKKDEEVKDEKMEEEEEEEDDDDGDIGEGEAEDGEGQEDADVSGERMEGLDEQASELIKDADKGGVQALEEKENQKGDKEGKNEGREGGRKVEKKEHKSRKDSDRETRSKRHSESDNKRDRRHSSGGDRKRDKHSSSGSKHEHKHRHKRSSTPDKKRDKKKSEDKKEKTEVKVDETSASPEKAEPDQVETEKESKIEELQASEEMETDQQDIRTVISSKDEDAQQE